MISIVSADALVSFCRHVTSLFEKSDGVCRLSTFESFVRIEAESPCRSVCARFEAACTSGYENVALINASTLSCAFCSYKTGDALSLELETGRLVVETTQHDTSTRWCVPLHADEDVNYSLRFPDQTRSTFQMAIQTVSHAVSHSDRITLECKGSNGAVRCVVPKSHETNPGGIGTSLHVTQSSQGEPFVVTCKWRALSKGYALIHKKTTPTCVIDHTQTLVLLRAMADKTWKCAVSIATIE